MFAWARALVAATLLATGLTVVAAPVVAADPPPSPNVHLFYYSWYGSPAVYGQYRHWQQGGHTPPNSVGADLYPTLGAYDSGDVAGAVNQHMTWVKRAGAGVIVYSWWGQGSYEDQLAQRVLDAAAAAGVKVAWHLEPYSGRTGASTVADINYLNNRYGSSPAYYRDAAHGNRPAFYVFQSLDVADWTPIAALKSTNIILAQTTDTSKVAHFGGMYTYDGIAGSTAPGWANAAAFCKANGLIWSPSVAPGYIDDRAVPGNTTPTVGRNNGATYDLQWNNALNPATGGLPDWVSVTSFNEWHEGSSIEPASSNPPAGNGYQTYNGAYGLTGVAAETAYLDRTRYWANEFTTRAGGGGDVTPPSPPALLRVTSKSYDRVSLQWNPSTDNVGVVGYNVYREAGATDPVVASPVTTSATIGFLQPSTQYQFYVRARDAAGLLSAPSNTIVVTTDPLTNLALNRPVTATSVNAGFGAGNAVDGNAGSYWESANNAFPQSITVDLGSVYNVSQVVLKLPPGWGTRTQNIGVTGSRDGVAYHQMSPASNRLFDPADGNRASVIITGGAARYVRVTINSNTGWPAAQLAEIEMIGTAPTDTAPPTVPANLAVTGKTHNSVSLSWSSSTDDTGVTGYQVRQNGTLVGGSATTSYTAVNLTPATAYTFTVVAVDLPGNLSGASSPVTATTNGAPVANLLFGKPVTSSGHVQNYIPGNVVDGNAGSYWESPNNAFPQWITVDMGSAQPVARVVLKLPPPAAWATRVQTLSVLGSTNGSTFSTVVGSAGYTFNPATGNTVTITFPASSIRYLRIQVTGNTGWPAGQFSEVEAYIA
jgi:glycoprotein endo-alpha-1,2-mannosidase